MARPAAENRQLRKIKRVDQRQMVVLPQRVEKLEVHRHQQKPALHIPLPLQAARSASSSSSPMFVGMTGQKVSSLVGGKSSRVHPDAPLPDWCLYSHRENHWTSVTALQEICLFMSDKAGPVVVWVDTVPLCQGLVFAKKRTGGLTVGQHRIVRDRDHVEKVSEVPCSRMSRIGLSACKNDSVPLLLVTASVAARWSPARWELCPALAHRTRFADFDSCVGSSQNFVFFLFLALCFERDQPQPCGRECPRRGVHTPPGTLRRTGPGTLSNAATPARRSLGVPLSRHELW